MVFAPDVSLRQFWHAEPKIHINLHTASVDHSAQSALKQLFKERVLGHIYREGMVVAELAKCVTVRHRRREVEALLTSPARIGAIGWDLLWLKKWSRGCDEVKRGLQWCLTDFDVCQMEDSRLVTLTTLIKTAKDEETAYEEAYCSCDKLGLPQLKEAYAAAYARTKTPEQSYYQTLSLVSELKDEYYFRMSTSGALDFLFKRPGQIIAYMSK